MVGTSAFDQWMWAIFSSAGTGIVMFALGLLRSGISDIKKHLNEQDRELGIQGQRISRIEGKLNVRS